MVTAIWLACASPRPMVQVTVVDGVSGRPRGGVEIVLHDVGETGICRQAFVSDAQGHATVGLCANEPYLVLAPPGLVVWPEVTDATSAEVPTIVVWDMPDADGLYIVGEGEVTRLEPQVDVKQVLPKSLDTSLPVPALVPLHLPVLGPHRALLAKGEAWGRAYPLVPLEGPVALREGGPLADWFGLGMGLDGVDVSVSPGAGALEAVGGASVWVRERLPAGRVVLWDGSGERARMVLVEP